MKGMVSMGFFSRVSDVLRRFMAGRYGNDRLNLATIILAVVFTIAYYITNIYPLWVLAFALLVWAVFRTFSRRHDKRAAELSWYLRRRDALLGVFKNGRARMQDETHKYFRCPQCGKTLRVPRGKGKIKIKCPCGMELTKRT